MAYAHDQEKAVRDDSSSEDQQTKAVEHAFTSVDENRDAHSYDELPRSLIAKIDLRLIPALAFMYGMSLIDRTDLPAARLNGAEAALGLGVGQRYTIITTTFFISYILFEIPANYVFKHYHIPPRLWLPSATMCFGLIKLFSAWTPNWQVLAFIRVLLGVFEAALFPGCVFLISGWYPRHVLAKRIVAFYLGGATLGGFGNIIAYGWGQIAPVPTTTANLEGWQWIFLMMGVLTCTSAIIGYIVVPNFPQTATSINEQERKMILKRIEIDRHDVVEELITFKDIVRNLGNIRIWAYGLLFCMSTLPVYAFAYFLPLIFRGYGYSVALSQILSAPPYVASLIWGFIAGALSDKTQHRGGFVILNALMALAGTVGLGYGANNNGRFASAFFAQMGAQANVALIVTWSSNNVRTANQRAVNSAIVVGGGGIGGILASVAFQQKDAPQYTPGLLTVIVSQIVICTVSLILMAFYRIRNKQANEGKRELEGVASYRFTL